MKKYWFQTFITVTILLGITTAIFLYTAGYRLQKNDNISVDFRKTGIISAKSLPKGANVYLNEVLKTATDDTIAALDPGTYTLKIVKNGFVTWEKEVEVFAELVTDITAVLVSQSPRLEPLTNTGARVPVISNSLNKLAYFSKDGTRSGIWIIPLTHSGLSLFKSEPFIAIEDTFSTIFSNGKSIEWSPDEQELLVQNANDVFYLVDINTKTTQSTTSPETVRERWDLDLLKARTDFIEKIDIPEEMVKKATSKDSLWSPDEKKFLYKVETPENVQYRVYNMEKPIPIGEKVDNLVFTVAKGNTTPTISWYADSFHLILTEGDIKTNKQGIISLIRIDGTNKTEVYNGTMFSDKVFSAPGGDKLIFLTSFKSAEQTDLYTIGIR